mgnify:CR=1 FL=1
MVLEKLGKDYTKTVYWLKDHKEPVKIDDPEEDGKFLRGGNVACGGWPSHQFAVAARPDWPKGHYRRGTALVALRAHGGLAAGGRARAAGAAARGR